jgi:hypothetical protein
MRAIRPAISFCEVASYNSRKSQKWQEKFTYLPKPPLKGGLLIIFPVYL